MIIIIKASCPDSSAGGFLRVGIIEFAPMFYQYGLTVSAKIISGAVAHG